MKRLVLAALIILACYSTGSQASTDVIAQTHINGEGSFITELVKLFSAEMAKPNSKLNKYMTELKNKNEGYFIDDAITELDVIRLESGGGAGSFSTDYLILIRAGYKSYTVQVGYLKADAIFFEDESKPTILRIVEPAKVTIE